MSKIIQTLKANETIKEFFLLTSLQSKLGKNGTYFEMVLSDASGEIKARKWDLTEKDYQLYETVRMELPKVVLVKGFTREFQQSIDLKVFYIVLPKEDETPAIHEFIPTAPLNVEDAFQVIEESMATIKNQTISTIVCDIYSRYKPVLPMYPASIHNHKGQGGLLWHTVNTILLCQKVISIYPSMLNEDLLIGAAILHDLAKVKDYMLNKGVVTKMADESKLIGHLVSMSHEIRDAARKHKINENSQEVQLLEHIILSHHGKGEYGSPVEPAIAEAHVLYLVNGLDSKIGAIFDLWQRTNDKEWSEWSPTLSSRLKKVKLED